VDELSKKLDTFVTSAGNSEIGKQAVASVKGGVETVKKAAKGL